MIGGFEDDTSLRNLVLGGGGGGGEILGPVAGAFLAIESSSITGILTGVSSSLTSLFSDAWRTGAVVALTRGPVNCEIVRGAAEAGRAVGGFTVTKAMSAGVQSVCLELALCGDGWW